MNTREAFEKLTDKRGWYALCGIDDTNARSLKHLFKRRKLSLDKMEALLFAAGGKKKPEAWSLPDHKVKRRSRSCNAYGNNAETQCR